MIPRTYLGQDGGAGIYELDRGHQDAGAAYEILAESRPLAAAGPDADCLIDRLYVALTFNMCVTLRVTPIVDEVDQESFDITCAVAPGERRRSRVFERELTVERNGYRTGLRGTWFSVRIESIGGLGAGDLILDAVSAHFHVEQPTKERMP